MSPTARLAATLGLAVAASVAVAVPAQAAVPAKYKNCATVQKTHPHGVGRANARDKTSGKPVTTFRKDTAAYNRAVNANRRLDADKDGIACEKR